MKTNKQLSQADMIKAWQHELSLVRTHFISYLDSRDNSWLVNFDIITDSHPVFEQLAGAYDELAREVSLGKSDKSVPQIVAYLCDAANLQNSLLANADNILKCNHSFDAYNRYRSAYIYPILEAMTSYLDMDKALTYNSGKLVDILKLLGKVFNVSVEPIISILSDSDYSNVTKLIWFIDCVFMTQMRDKFAFLINYDDALMSSFLRDTLTMLCLLCIILGTICNESDEIPAVNTLYEVFPVYACAIVVLLFVTGQESLSLNSRWRSSGFLKKYFENDQYFYVLKVRGFNNYNFLRGFSFLLDYISLSYFNDAQDVSNSEADVKC